MNLTLYQIDAFTDELFGGNPAAVIPLEKWLDEKLMQKIALENNFARKKITRKATIVQARVNCK